MPLKKSVHPNLSGFAEPITGFCSTITSDHAYIHQGLGFSANYNTGSLAGDALYKTIVTAPAASTGKVVHLRPSNFSATANVMTLALYEDSTNTGGTAISRYNHSRASNPIVASTIVKTGATVALTGKNINTAAAGGNFANQPGGSKVTAVSDNNVEDKIPTLTIYGTKTGATATVTSETIQLNGTTAVDTALITWQNILGAELSAACTGTITIKNGAAATIITIAAGTLTKGIVTITDARGRDQILRAISSGASTAPVGIIGTGPTGSAVSSVIALNGTNSVNLNSDIFRTVTKLLNGAAASTVNITFSRPEVLLFSITAGSGGSVQGRSGGGAGADDEWILEPGIDYVFVVTNGSTTASIGTVNLFFYEENY